MLPTVFSQRQGLRAVCQRVRRVHPFLCREWCILGVRGAPGGPVDVGGVQALVFNPFMFTEPELRMCAYRRTRPFGGGRRRHHNRSLLKVQWVPLSCTSSKKSYHNRKICCA